MPSAETSRSGVVTRSQASARVRGSGAPLRALSSGLRWVIGGPPGMGPAGAAHDRAARQASGSSCQMRMTGAALRRSTTAARASAWGQRTARRGRRESHHVAANLRIWTPLPVSVNRDSPWIHDHHRRRHPVPDRRGRRCARRHSGHAVRRVPHRRPRSARHRGRGGRGERYRIDPLLARGVFVAVCMVSAGLGLLAYAAAWAVLPDADGRVQFGRLRRREWQDATVAIGVIGA
ncbi:PspC domain-containing protein, partial [Streptomyces sp. NPDC052127]|uniref:PspC domain-containing protein n=1 Tax=Streptomyces sp. NPDC052127 TaxID=3155679 RepID=UPI0034170415